MPKTSFRTFFCFMGPPKKLRSGKYGWLIQRFFGTSDPKVDLDIRRSWYSYSNNLDSLQIAEPLCNEVKFNSLFYQNLKFLFKVWSKLNSPQIFLAPFILRTIFMLRKLNLDKNHKRWIIALQEAMENFVFPNNLQGMPTFCQKA